MKRFSRVTLDKGHITNNGFIKAPAFLTRTGVFTYRKADGTVVKELRHPDDVFDPASLATLEMVPLTDDHPQEFVTPSNAKELQVGWIGENVEPKNDFIAATVVVSEKNTIAKVDTGKVELSCGYTADLVAEEGIYKGERYDMRQTNIRYNHVAVVDRGRAGPQVKIRMDADDAFETEEQVTKQDPTKEAPQMKKITIDGKEFEVSQEIADAFESANKKNQDNLNAANEKADSASKELATAKKSTETLQAKLDVAEGKLAERKDSAPSQAEIDGMVATRTRVLDAANKVIGKEFKADGKSNMEVMKEVVAKAKPTLDMAAKSDTYVEVVFDSIVDEQAGKETRVENIGRKVTDSRKEEEFDDKTAREKARTDAQDAWKQPLAISKK